jgi:hypothetical protein
MDVSLRITIYKTNTSQIYIADETHPFCKYMPAVTVPNKKPEHAAVKSNATVLVVVVHPTAEAMEGETPNTHWVRRNHWVRR